MKTCTRNLLIAATMFCAVNIFTTAHAQGTVFTYQGRLDDGGAPANGTYNFSFSLYNVSSGGSAVAGPIPTIVLPVTNGLFTANLTFSPSLFDGTTYWLQIGVNTNGGSGFTQLATRQELTPAPYAFYAANAGSSVALSGTVAAGGLSGTYTGPVIFNNPADSFAGNGSGLTNVNAALLNGFSASSFWKTTGNNGTSPTTGNFLGTIDNQPLELAVNQQRALRLESTGATITPNLIGGSSGNFIVPGSVGSLIAGGGSINDNGSVETNTIGANYSLIAGGVGNTINNGSDYSLIGGGFFNLIDATSPRSALVGGEQNIISAGTDHSYLGGGEFNEITSGSFDVLNGGVNNLIDAFDSSSVISGGDQNFVSGNSATIAGGDANKALNTYATVGGGSHNVASGFSATVAGGGEFFIAGIVDKAHPNIPPTSGNTASGDLSAIGGGRANVAAGDASTVAGGDANQATGNDSTVAGGTGNISTNTSATVGGGQLNVSGGFASVVAGGNTNVANGDDATVGGGQHNNASGNNSTVAGGFSNGANGDQGTVGGGLGNVSFGAGDTLAGGLNNSSGGGNVSTISGGTGNSSLASEVAIGGGSFNSGNADFSTISGGASNTISGVFGTVSGGYSNTVSGQTAFVAGGEFNQAASNRTFAAGTAALATNEGAFVWADYSTNSSAVPFPFGSANRNEFAVRSTGGARFVTAVDPTTGAATAGISLAPNGTSWSTISDRNAKKDFTAINPETILNKLAAVPVEQWHYKWEAADTTPNIGPMAQDFIQAFYPGRNDKSITTLEFDGVELAAIQGLNQKVAEQMKQKDEQIQDLTKRLETLEKLLHEKTSN